MNPVNPHRSRLHFPTGEDPSSHVIAVVNQKGGVGKTTTAVNLAASLAASEHATLLIDFDPQGNASSAFGCFEPERQIYDALLGGASLASVSQPTELSHLHLAPAAADLVGAEVELVGLEGRESRLRNALDPIRHRYDFILIDCPPSLGFLTLNALTAADGVLIPLQCEYYALEGLARLMDTISRMKPMNESLEVEGIVFTMFDARSNLSRQVAEEAREHFGDRVFETVIPRNVRLSEAPSHGKPVLLYDIRSRGAQAYLQLAKELLSRDRRRPFAPRRPPALPHLAPPTVGGPHGPTS